MKFTKFRIENFKGIESLEINLNKSPQANIYTLVGLNESGKTTILEAINLYNKEDSGLNALGESTSTIKDLNSLIPISKRDNFNGIITISGEFELDEDDWNQVDFFVDENTLFKKVSRVASLSWSKRFVYENSKFKTNDHRWTGMSGILKNSVDGNAIFIDDKNYQNDNFLLVNYVRSITPSILYYPNSIFEFPNRIYVQTENQATPKENFYIDLIQDILFSLENNTNIKIHITDRIKSADATDKKSLDSLTQKMGRKVTEVVFDAWNRIFKRTLADTKIIIKTDVDEKRLAYLEFEIESPSGNYQINERSLGFRWFFIFLLFTQFRPFRKASPKNLIFLFDEPAANLHSVAQSQLLKSFETLTENCKIIYTTHSHHLINPHWLESTYIVRNEGLVMDTPESYSAKETKISIQPYREFVSDHPHNTAYFQPILDVLQYSPSNLELIPHCIFLEGKNDYYTLEYFSAIIFNNEFDLNLSPSTSATNLDTLISLYLGWGRKFVILLDSDREGNLQKQRYINQFGIFLENRIYQMHDVDSSWINNGMEKLISDSDLLNFQKESYPTANAYHKIHFNRAVQEHLIQKKPFEFSEETKNNIRSVLIFLSQKMKLDTDS